MKQSKEIQEIEYSEEFQVFIVQLILSYPEIFIAARNILKPHLWNDDLRPCIKLILEYYDTNHISPNVSYIHAKTGFLFEKFDAPLDERDRGAYLKEIENFVIHRELEKLILEGHELLSKGRYGEIERRAKEALMISLSFDLGLNYFENPAERLRIMLETTPKIPFGWTDLDEATFGGTTIGELTLYCGIPNAGKSVALQNQTINWSQQGYNGVYISLEMESNQIAQRLDAMLTQQSTRSVIKDISGTESKLMYIKNKHNMGEIIIKRFPESQTTVNHIRAYLQELYMRTGIKAQFLATDYMDILKPSDNRVDPNNAWAKDKAISEELRALGSEWKLLNASASQLNRDGVKDQADGVSMNFAHISGGISKMNTVDNAFAIVSTPSMREKGIYKLAIIKARDSNANGKTIELGYDPDFMRIKNKTVNTSVDNTQRNSNIQQKLAAIKSTQSAQI